MTIEYAFRIHRPDDKEDEYSKVGHVVVSRTEKGLFKGRFVDLLIPSEGNNEDEELRSGDVILQR